MAKPASVKIPLIGWELLLLAALVVIAYSPNIVPMLEESAGQLGAVATPPVWVPSMTLSLNVSPTSGTITPKIVTVRGNVSATVTSTISGTITFSAKNLPSGVMASFSPTSCNLNYKTAPKCNSTFALAATPQAASGTYTITISAATGTTPIANKTFTLVVDKTPPTVTAAQTIDWDVATITATATDSSGIAAVDVYVDNIKKKSCTSSPCVYSGNYSPGSTHMYYAAASDKNGNAGRNPASGTKSFTVKALSKSAIKALEDFYGGIAIYGVYSGSGCTELLPEFGGQGIEDPPEEFYVADFYSFLNVRTPDGYVGELEEARLRSLTGTNLLKALTTPRTFHGWALAHDQMRFIGVGWPILRCSGEQRLQLYENPAYISPADLFIDKPIMTPPEPSNASSTFATLPSTGIATIPATGAATIPVTGLAGSESQTYEQPQCKAVRELCVGNETGDTYALLIMGSRELQFGEVRFRKDINNMQISMKALSVPESRITTIGLEEDINPDTIANAISNLATKAGPCDNVLIYYVDHGDRGKIYAGTEKGRNEFPYSRFAEILKTFNNSTKITIIIDACYSGTAIPILSDNVTGRPNTQIITAAPSDASSYDDPSNRGTFTQGLMNGFDDLVLSDNECVGDKWLKNWHQCWAKAYPYALESAIKYDFPALSQHYPLCILPFKTISDGCKWFLENRITRAAIDGMITATDAVSYKQLLDDAVNILKTNWAGRQTAYNKLLELDRRIDEKIVNTMNFYDAFRQAEEFGNLKSNIVMTNSHNPAICAYLATVVTNESFCATNVIGIPPYGHLSCQNLAQRYGMPLTCEKKNSTWVAATGEMSSVGGICNQIIECWIRPESIIENLEDDLTAVATESLHRIINSSVASLRDISTKATAQEMYSGITDVDKKIAEELLKIFGNDQTAMQDELGRISFLKTALLQQKASADTCIVDEAYASLVDRNTGDASCFRTIDWWALSYCSPVLNRPYESIQCERKQPTWWIPPAGNRTWGVCDAIYECKENASTTANPALFTSPDESWMWTQTETDQWTDITALPGTQTG